MPLLTELDILLLFHSTKMPRLRRFPQCKPFRRCNLTKFDVFIHHSAFCTLHWIHAGTGSFLTASSTTPRAVTPEKRACGSSTRRCAITGTASD